MTDEIITTREARAMEEAEAEGCQHYRITETITFEVMGTSAQDALDRWLQDGEQATGYRFCEVGEREVTDERGRFCEVEEPC